MVYPPFKYMHNFVALSLLKQINKLSPQLKQVCPHRSSVSQLEFDNINWIICSLFSRSLTSIVPPFLFFYFLKLIFPVSHDHPVLSSSHLSLRKLEIKTEDKHLSSLFSLHMNTSFLIFDLFNSKIQKPGGIQKKIFGKRTSEISVGVGSSFEVLFLNKYRKKHLKIKKRTFHSVSKYCTKSRLTKRKRWMFSNCPNWQHV